jgi:hypothetical protein
MTDKDMYSRSDYDEELHTYGQLLGAAISVSQAAGGIKAETRYIRATQIFTRMVVIAYTFFRLLPVNPITCDKKEHWDWPSVAALARNFLEAYLNFFYIGVEDVTKDEIAFRMKAMWFHLNSEKYRIYKNGPTKLDLAEFEKNLPIEKRQIQEHTFFQQLNKEQQQRVLSATSPTYMTKYQLMARLPFPSKELMWMYRHYSNEVHSTAFAFNSQSNERGRGDENLAERAYMIFTSWLVRKYLSSAIMSMAKIFPKEVGVGSGKAVQLAQVQFDKFMQDL